MRILYMMAAAHGGEEKRHPHECTYRKRERERERESAKQGSADETKVSASLSRPAAGS
jgi:hypothetical protein